MHSTLAVEAGSGQPLGLLWQKIWHREAKMKPDNETPTQKKARLARERKAQTERRFEHKESYRWVEAMKEVFQCCDRQANALPELRANSKNSRQFKCRTIAVSCPIKR
ncbi:MAG: hypothetical protein AB1861_14195 [Cyanobacteriota bacterium]